MNEKSLNKIHSKHLKVRVLGDPVLREQSRPIEEITPQIKELAYAMVECMDQNHGIGLAAPQVGIPIRLFVRREYITLPNGTWSISSDYKVFINPKIVSFSKETWEEEEGCLSIPGLRQGPVKRPYKVTVEAMDLEGKKFTIEYEAENARVIFHENDHLNGVLYIDRLPPRERKKIEPYLRKLQKKE